MYVLIKPEKFLEFNINGLITLYIYYGNECRKMKVGLCGQIESIVLIPTQESVSRLC